MPISQIPLFPVGDLPDPTDPATYHQRFVAFEQWLVTAMVPALNTQSQEVADAMPEGTETLLAGFTALASRDFPARELTIFEEVGAYQYVCSSSTVKALYVILTGPSGGSGAADTDGTGQVGFGGGGGAGPTYGFFVPIADPTTYQATITISAGGAAGVGDNSGETDGGDGSHSIFSDGVVSAFSGFGKGGKTVADVEYQNTARGGGVELGSVSGAVGTVLIHAGQAGAEGWGIANELAHAGDGGASYWGAGGRGAVASANGQSRAGGAGGRGAGPGGSASKATLPSIDGVDGAPGICAIREIF